MNSITIQYHFNLKDGHQEFFDIEIDSESLELINSEPKVLPYWTELDFFKCPNCPLNKEQSPHCPLAIQLVSLVERFTNVQSFDQIQLEVIMEDRNFSKETTAHRGVSSLMGLIVATCGCPRTAYFKPMARFHLPMANRDETLYRAASMYLLAQYFIRKQGKDADLELEGLTNIYKEVQLVNIGIANRLRAASREDASVNAVIYLDVFAKTIPFVIEESLEPLRHIFNHYI